MRERPPVRRLALALAAGLGLGGAFYALRSPEPGGPAAGGPALASLGAPAAPKSVTLRIERPGSGEPGIPAPLSLAAATARDYRERARYPRWSQPIRDGVDPILRDREVTPAVARAPGEEGLTLRVWPRQVSFEAPRPVVIFAELERDGQRLDPQELRGEVRGEDGATVAELEFRDDGREGDERAGDLRFTARLDPSTAAGKPLRGAYLVSVDATPGEGEPLNAVSGFLYSHPRAHLTGRYRESLAGGSLVVEAEVRVAERGRFHLEATLGTPQGTPLAWAQNALELGPGEHWIPLTFYGLILREAGTPGPYALLSVALSTTGEMPNHKNEVARHAYTTRPYGTSDFTANPFQDPDLLEAAERLEGAGGFDASRLEVGSP